MKRILILSILMLFVMSGFSYGYIEANWSCLFFSHCENNRSTNRATPSLGQMVSEAGALFLKAGRDYQDFLHYVEQSEYSAVDGSNLINSLDNAIKNMEEANARYYDIWKISTTLEANPLALELLASFDYQTFREKNQLIPGIFKKVKSFLKKGNVEGVYEYLTIETGVLLQKLTLLKARLDGNNLDLPLCWEINQLQLKNLLLGQYISQVFAEIKKSL